MSVSSAFDTDVISMIEVENLSKRYGLHLAVDSISFSAQKGEVVGLLGPNGAGKTTTMRILTGFMPPSSGTARIAGFDIIKDSLEARQRVGYLPEQVPVYPDMTVREYIRFWAELRGIRKSRAHVDAALEKVQLTSRRNSLIRNISKGMRQRLGLAQAIVHNPEVIILDEPTIGIDPQQVIEVRESVRQLGESHTVLFSTHILSEVEQVCDRVLIINKGRIVAEGKPAELRQKLQPGAYLFVQFTNVDPVDAMSLLLNIPHVLQAEMQGEGLAVRVEPGVDVRADIFSAAAQAGAAIVELRPMAMTLEDIFLDIVGKAN
jgi:ABC-2 type transport system ATP-binding protein